MKKRLAVILLFVFAFTLVPSIIGDLSIGGKRLVQSSDAHARWRRRSSPQSKDMVIGLYLSYTVKNNFIHGTSGWKRKRYLRWREALNKRMQTKKKNILKKTHKIKTQKMNDIIAFGEQPWDLSKHGKVTWQNTLKRWKKHEKALAASRVVTHTSKRYNDGGRRTQKQKSMTKSVKIVKKAPPKPKSGKYTCKVSKIAGVGVTKVYWTQDLTNTDTFQQCKDAAGIPASACKKWNVYYGDFVVAEWNNDNHEQVRCLESGQPDRSYPAAPYPCKVQVRKGFWGNARVLRTINLDGKTNFEQCKDAAYFPFPACRRWGAKPGQNILVKMNNNEAMIGCSEASINNPPFNRKFYGSHKVIRR